MEQEEIQKTSEERFKELVEKIRPYILQLWTNKKKFIIFNFAVLILSIAYLLFLTEPYYRSTVSILPEYGNKNTALGQISGLAAMAGVRVGDAVPTEIYQILITSESILEPVIYQKYLTKEYKDSVDLVKYFKIKVENSENANLDKRKVFLSAFEGLSGSINTDMDRMTKILTVTVTMPESKLSADVANSIASSLDYYIRTKRKSFASEQRFYLEKRVKQVQDSLTIAENTLKDFREQNRMITQSPMLLLEEGRLMRQVEIMQMVFIAITKQLEIAKIDEIKDAPIVNLKEKAKDPVKKSGPKRMTSLIMILFFSFILSSTYLIFRDKLKYYTKIIIKGGKRK